MTIQTLRFEDVSSHSKQGMVLPIVLAFLVLVSALIIGFFLSATTELKSSQSYTSGAFSKQLADSAVGLVMAQIGDATSGTDSSLTGPVAWASQPGMIRAYDQNGKPVKYYKLYSSGTLILSASTGIDSFNSSAELPDQGWDKMKGLYTDLNSPITRGTDTFYPIVDPRASGTNSNGIEGFSYDLSNIDHPALSGSVSSLPMPVRWLYVLQNGALANPVTSNNGIVSFDTRDKARVPSSQNPIVGRIAFWTDDDTCKLNINTASEGTFWDRPWANTVTEQHYATAIPALNEFQRFPGHPAKTCLSTVFQSILPTPNPSQAWNGSVSANQGQLKAYYDLLPRFGSGGTMGGTVTETTSSGSPNSAFAPISLAQNRLYASVDELFFNPARTQNLPALNNSLLQQTRFFLTAHNRSPELNLFGRPRITLWPIQTGTSDRTTKDSLIAFCSTINSLPYYFQRLNTYTRNPITGIGGSSAASSQSATADWTNVPRNQQLYNYLDYLTQQAIPGFGGSFSADPKYSSTRRQVLTEMFDMIRSGVNSYSVLSGTNQSNYVPNYLDPGEGQVIPIQLPNGTQGFGRTSAIVGATLVFYRTNQGSVAADANGVVLTSTSNPDLRTQLNPSGVVVSGTPQIGAVLILNPYTPTPGLPPLNPNLQYVVTGLNGANSFQIKSPSTPAWQSLKFPAGPLTNIVTARSEFSGMANCSPYFGTASAFRYAYDLSGTNSKGDGTKTAGTGGYQQYPFITTSGVAVGGTNDVTFDFSGGSIQIQVFAGADTARTQVLQTINMNFPAVSSLLIPTTDPANSGNASQFANSYFNRIGGGGAPGTAITKSYRKDGLILNHAIPNLGIYSNRTATPLGKDRNGNPVIYWVQDIARGLEADPDGPAKGDLRFYAALSNIPVTFFRPCRAPDGSDAYDFPVSDPNNQHNLIIQRYTNVQSLRDEGTDGGGGGGFGFDNSSYTTTGATYANVALTGAAYPYPHYPTWGGGSSNAARQLLISTFATGSLIPISNLAAYGRTNFDGSVFGAQEYRSSAHPAAAVGLASAQINGGAFGDWDNMTGLIEDGAFINKPDEGNGSTVSKTGGITNVNAYWGGTDISGGYFSSGFSPTANFFNIDPSSGGASTYSPNRQVSSAAMFGSLPTGIDPSGSNLQPWQTLLFCANPAAGKKHPGFGSPVNQSPGLDPAPPYTYPPDHLFLDLFSMPIVEPYAISEPFSTAGKVNMNYQLMPFSYIRRDTGLRAVLKSTDLIAIPQSLSTFSSNLGNSYKDGQQCKYELRYNINPDETAGTLAGFEARFKNNDIFHSASEICGIYLVPQQISPLASGVSYPPGSTPPSTYSSTANWWSDFQLTGKNTREMPYGDLYARLTTKSNTYTVHYQVQTLKKTRSTKPDQWVEGTDQVTGEARGATTVERYIDLSNSSLPDFTDSSKPSAESYYKIHVIGSTTFNP